MWGVTVKINHVTACKMATREAILEALGVCLICKKRMSSVRSSDAYGSDALLQFRTEIDEKRVVVGDEQEPPMTTTATTTAAAAAAVECPACCGLFALVCRRDSPLCLRLAACTSFLLCCLVLSKIVRSQSQC